MSIGRVSTFLDIYIERDIKKVFLQKIEAQELIDHFVVKIKNHQILEPRIRFTFLWPVWVTESIGGLNKDGGSYVTKTLSDYYTHFIQFRCISRTKLNCSLERKTTRKLEKYCAKVSIDTSSLQYEK